MNMTLKKAHAKAVSRDRILRIDGAGIKGKWYEDHILDYVAKNGHKKVNLTIATAEYIAVTMQE